MADAIIFGTESELCTDPDDVGCGHTAGVHGNASGGCSYIGVSGWCECTWAPKRDGAAFLLEITVSDDYTRDVEFDDPEAKGPSR